MITLRHLRFLTAVERTLNFSRAAEMCFVTQPTPSAGVKELEDRLGVQLVERTKRGVMLTPVGKEVAARGRQVLLDAEEIETVARAHRDPFEGDLRLGSIPTIGPFLLPRLLPGIRDIFPRLRLYLREEMTESLIDGLNDGRSDRSDGCNLCRGGACGWCGPHPLGRYRELGVITDVRRTRATWRRGNAC